ncbi:Midasin [Aphelenchoides besseyi]|nr:Midasin [Aphelenchoides besseyi]
MSTRKRKAPPELEETIGKSSRLVDSRPTSIDDYPMDQTKVDQALLLIKKNPFVKLIGPYGCGRTTIAFIAAKNLEPTRTPTVIYVNDQLDSKSLFGSYECTGIPGDFTWEESVFATNIKKPNSLIVLKGFESASSDLVAAVLKLAEEGFHPLPGGRCIKLHSTVRIVATVNESNDLQIPRILTDYPIFVQLREYQPSDVHKIVCRRFGMATEHARIYYECFCKIRAIVEKFSASERRLNISDFLVGCQRVCKQTAQPTAVFSDLCESWVLHLSKPEYREAAIDFLLNCLSLDQQTLNFLQNVRVVEVQTKNGKVTIGRVSLDVQTTKPPSENISAFALTRDYGNLLERIAVCVNNEEPVLLNGETGIGKTRVIQQLADYANVNLRVVNLSLDSDASDLIGGYKPTSLRLVVRQFMSSFFSLLEDAPHHTLLRSRLLDLYTAHDYTVLLNTILDVCLRAMVDDEQEKIRDIWGSTYARGRRILEFVGNTAGATPFAFENGVIARAIRDGDWLLIDEINMASIECLNSIASLLNEQNSQKNPNFRLFACMNPANDSGKRRLPNFIRSKFTEFFVEETREKAQLNQIVRHYMPQLLSTDVLTNFYMEITKKLTKKFSLRNLCRSLLMTRDDVFRDKAYSLYTALELGFSAGTDPVIGKDIFDLMQKHHGKKPVLKVRPLADEMKKELVLVEGVRFPRGPLLSIEDDGFVYTNSVQINLQRIACGTAKGRFPVLLEGETSAGKTSILTHLAKRTGHRLHRINNHEHTDVQEYFGSYVADEKNQLVFREGILLQAMRNGDWVILDELNLAPTEVLESLNRLLDDNREVYVAETDTVIKANSRFRIFATQNPVGAYSGRKRLSRAFMNRFVILNIQQPPNNELCQIVCARCKIHQTAAELMITVMSELKALRSNSNLFSASDSFMTLRDLFRWANRFANYADHSDWRQVVADQGYLLLAGRCRKNVDALKVQEVISHVTKRRIDVESMFSMESHHFPALIREMFTNKSMNGPNQHMILTRAMRRMLVQCAQAFRVNEPVLLVGETGCGKTSVVYLLAERGLEFINCHERTDTSDLLGRIRPTTSGMFTWEDGVVVRAMKEGSFLLLDEISLAQDSVLERLNPLLESDRTLLLTDCGAQTEMIRALSGFQCIATMNPGGDHGKKELSKALRNRFTEIWCEFDFNEDDVAAIICRRSQSHGDGRIEDHVAKTTSRFFASYFGFFYQKFGHLFKTAFSVRDAIVVAEMFGTFVLSSGLSVFDAAYHTVSSVILDALPVLPTRGLKVDYQAIVEECQKQFVVLFRELLPDMSIGSFATSCTVSWTSDGVAVGNFNIPIGRRSKQWPQHFCFDAPSSQLNAMRVARGLASEKPIMLEGTPGCGKSSLVKAMAELAGYELIRVNLSEETEVSDLFGTDVPITLPNGQVSFEWQDGPVLKAIKDGAWLLLDEMNLASQAILEALNSCFDFRNTLYIAELGRGFEISRNSTSRCRFFSCQNPEKEGGGRKALPKSFLNRFTKIYVQPMTEEDLRVIVGHGFSGEDSEETTNFYIKLHHLSNELISIRRGNQVAGAPYEYNLRDLLRLIEASKELPIDLAYELVYVSRLHNANDRSKVRDHIFRTILNRESQLPVCMLTTTFDGYVDFGGGIRLKRSLKYNDTELGEQERFMFSPNCQLFASQTNVLQRIAACVHSNFLVLLSGPANCGKRSMIETLARLANMPLRVLRMTSETDAQDLLGSYEQVYFENRVARFAIDLKELLEPYARMEESATLLKKLEMLGRLKNPNDIRTIAYSLLEHVTSDETRQSAQYLVDGLATETLHFEWMDSELVQAYTNGEWLLVEDVNACSAAVLDRLNCCLEQDGELVITEKADGEFQAVQRSPQFRIFFTMNSEAGNLSAAMRNRAVEIRLLESEQFPNSTVDKIRLLGDGELERVMAPLAGTSALEPLNELGKAEMLQLRSYSRNGRAKSLGLTPFLTNICEQKLNVTSLRSARLERFPPVGCSLESYFNEYYQDGWLYYLNLNDPAVVFFYSRVVSGTNTATSLSIAVNDEGMSTELLNACRELSELKAPTDCSIVGVERATQMSESEVTAMNENIVAHFSLWLRWIYDRVKTPSNSSMHKTQQILRESNTPTPTIELAAYRLHLAISHALRQSDSRQRLVSEYSNWRLELFKLVFECSLFDSLLRHPWNKSVGDVALWEVGRRLYELGVSDLLGTTAVRRESTALFEFGQNPHRGTNWRRLCPLPPSTVSIFDNQKTLKLAQSQLHKAEEVKMVPWTELVNSNDFVIDVTNQFLLIASLVNTLSSSSIDLHSNVLSLPIRSLCVFLFGDETVRQQLAKILILNTRVPYGDNSIPLVQLCTNGVTTGPLLRFWRHLDFRRSLHSVPIGELVDFTKKLQTLLVFIWRLSQCQGKLRRTICNSKDAVESEISEFTSLHQNKIDERPLMLGIERMKSHVPSDAVDPVLRVYAEREWTKAAMSVLTSHSEVLERYSMAVFGTSEWSAFDSPGMANESQFMGFMRKRYADTLRSMDELRKLGDVCRPPNSEYQRLGQEICEFIKLTQRFCSNFDYSRVSTYIQELQHHRCKLLHNYFAYPDIIVPYLQGTAELEFEVNKRALEQFAHKQREICTSLRADPTESLRYFGVKTVDHPIDSVEATKFHLSEGSQLPEHSQLELLIATLERLTPAHSDFHSVIEAAFEWLKLRWSSWFDAHSAKRTQLYEYRQTSRRQREMNSETDELNAVGEDEIPDVEMAEIRQMLPDFSNMHLNEPPKALETNELVSVTEEDLLRVIRTLMDCGQTLQHNFYTKLPTNQTSVYLPSLFLFGLSEFTAPLDEETEVRLSMHHVVELRSLLESFICRNGDQTLDVYRFSDSATVLDCVSKMHQLKQKALEHQLTFPENAILSELLGLIDTFMSLPCDNPQMAFASLLEKLLEKSELWEKTVGRTYSLSKELTPLREILLEWRKSEVRCWSEILKRVGDDLRRQCVLSAWPLIDAFTSIPTTDYDEANYKRNLISMLLQWLQDSSLFDLSSRLIVFQFLVVALRVLNLHVELIPKMESIGRYFAQFIPRLENKVVEVRAEVEEKLKNLVQVARYTDLNLWSVKDSAQRVHSQLCRLIHQFKNLTQNAEHLYSLLQTEVDYDEVERLLKEEGKDKDREAVDEAKRKAHGAELAKRQRTFAVLAKSATDYGVSFRRGLQLSTEQMNELSMTGRSDGASEVLKSLVNSSVFVRNVAVKSLAVLNLHDKPHLRSQLSPKHFALLKGTVEFALSVIVNTNNRARSLVQTAESLRDARISIDRLLEIQTNSEETKYNHEFLSSETKGLFADITALKEELTVVQRYVAACPQPLEAMDSVFQFDFGCRRLNSAAELVLVGRQLSSLHELLNRIELQVLNWMEKADGTPWIWSRQKIEIIRQFAVAEVAQLSETSGHLHLLLGQTFNYFRLLEGQLAERVGRMLSHQVSNSSEPSVSFDVNSLKLKIQTIYRVVEQQKLVEKGNPIEKLRVVLTSIGTIKFKEIEQQIWSYIWQLGRAEVRVDESIRQVLSVVAAFVDALDVISRRMILFLEWFLLFHLRFCAIVHHLTQHGLVKPIPQPEKSSEGEGQSTTGNGDACGMGEGQGDNDVSGQIEETGQLEELQGAEQENTDGVKDGEKNENPIEMEDDFAADLEDIDGEEQDEDNQEGPEEPDAAEQADWDSGDVEDADEKQLDPKLWDEQSEVPQTMDQEEQGADEETGELAAQNEKPKEVTEIDDTEQKETNENVEDETDDTHMENMDDINLDDEDQQDEMDPEGTQMETEEGSVDAEEQEPSGPMEEDQEMNEEEPETQNDDVNVPEASTEEQQKSTTEDTTFGLPMSSEEQQNADKSNNDRPLNDAETNEKTNEANQDVAGDKRGAATAEGSSNLPDDESEPMNEETTTSNVATRRKQTDDQLMDVDTEAITEVSEDTPMDERSENFAHITDQHTSTADRQVIQKSTVEEASVSRERLQHQQSTPIEQTAAENSRTSSTVFAKITGESHVLDGTFLRTTMDRDYSVKANESVAALKRSLEQVEASGSTALELKWSAISDSVASEATELAENLRIIIEPTIASKLQGDYRTGKRLNMRRLVPYIASNFRKDRIWLRRTKAANRNYQICLAIDDSASMKDNLMTEITCQAVCLLERAFQQLAVGEVSICKFGAEVELLREFHDSTTSDELGLRLLHSLRFDQNKTNLLRLLSSMAEHFAEGRFASSRAPANQLLIIVGDGRGTLNMGAERVAAAVGRLLDEGVVVLYLIVDNPESSVFAIKSFQKGRLVDYMTVFPFPFYTVVQSKNIIPLAVSEAIRQWFDLTQDH